MNELQVFNNDEFGSIRTVTLENEPLTEKLSPVLGLSQDKEAAGSLTSNVKSSFWIVRRAVKTTK